MNIEPLLLSDLPYISALTPEGWTDITPHYTHNLTVPFCHPVKAMVDGAMIGLGNIVENEDTVWLSAIIVNPVYRNRGIGIAITQWLVDSVDRSKFKTILLDATEYGFPVYQKLGFEVIAEHAHYTGATMNVEMANEHIIPFEEQYRLQVYELDRMATDENRQNTLAGMIEDSILYVSGNNVLGAYYPSSAKGMIIASEPTAGTELMKHRLQTWDYCMLPADNKTAIDFLRQQGFLPLRTSRRMRLGPPRNWNPTYIYNSMSGTLG